jgi:REP element-mobilizing transposase RayT
MASTKVGPQLELGFRAPPRKRLATRGRPKKRGAGVPHVHRQVDARVPLHVTLKMHRHVWQLRSRRCFRILETALRRGCAAFGSRVCQFSVQHNHVHLLVEAADARALGRALQGMCIRVARGLNTLMGRKGAVFADRYHARSLHSPTEVRRVLVYLFRNAHKHLRQMGYAPSVKWLDEYSSAAWFDGWREAVAPPAGVPPPVARAQTWLLAAGYRRGGGLIGMDELPAGG